MENNSSFEISSKDDQQLVQDEFPIVVFPLPIQEIIKATNESLTFPVDYISASMLFAASVAIGNTYKVHIKNGYLESAVLYLALVGRPGINKSHPLKFALDPIYKHDSQSYKEYKKKLNEYKQSLKKSKKDQESDSVLLVEPSFEKRLLSDFTPEALADVLNKNQRGIGVHIDEIIGWFKNFNRYNNSNAMEFWLSVWSNTAVNIDRKTSEPIHIPIPFISVAGTIQSNILKGLVKDDKQENGFVDRILFVFPDNLKRPYLNDDELGEDVIKSWHVFIDNLLGVDIHKDEYGTPIPTILQFSKEAKELHSKWKRTNTDQINNDLDEESIGIATKLDIYVTRLALILQLMSWASGIGKKEKIELEAVKGAISLVKYFQKSALKARSFMLNDDPLATLPINFQKLYHALPDTFKTRDGVEIAIALGESERNFKRLLKNQSLFKWIRRGLHEKLLP